MESPVCRLALVPWRVVLMVGGFYYDRGVGEERRMKGVGGGEKRKEREKEGAEGMQSSAKTCVLV